MPLDTFLLPVLVTLGEGAEDTRRRAARSELLAVVGDPDTAEEILDTYAAYRLLTLDNDPATRAPTVELAHEALIREWERLKGWLNAAREEIRLQRQLSGAAQEWHAAREDASFLLRGARLDVFEAWARRTTLALTPREKKYLADSVQARAQQQAAEATRLAREQRLERRALTTARTLVAVLTLALLGAVLLSGFAFTSRSAEQDARATSDNNALRAQQLALVNGARAALANDNPDAARALAAAANRGANPSGQAQSVLADAAYAPGTVRVFRDGANVPPGSPVQGHVGPVNFAAFTPDGRFLLSGADNRLLLWDLQTGVPLREYNHIQELLHAVLSPDGQTVIAGYRFGHVVQWDVATGTRLREYRFAGDSSVWSIALSANGRTALLGTEDNRLTVWDVQGWRPVRAFDVGAFIAQMVFTPDETGVLMALYNMARTS